MKRTVEVICSIISILILITLLVVYTSGCSADYTETPDPGAPTEPVTSASVSDEYTRDDPTHVVVEQVCVGIDMYENGSAMMFADVELVYTLDGSLADVNIFNTTLLAFRLPDRFKDEMALLSGETLEGILEQLGEFACRPDLSDEERAELAYIIDQLYSIPVISGCST